MAEKNGPAAGDHGPKGSFEKQERDPFTELPKPKQGDRRDPVTAIINGEPVAKGRPRMTRRGFTYTPAHTRKYEAHGRLAAQLAMDGRPPIEGPVRVELLAELPIPASWSNKKRARAITGDVLPIGRPDLDNFVKSAQDAINEIVIRDDSQIIEVSARKRYGVAPKLVMTVFPPGAACSNRGRNRATSAVTEAFEAARSGAAP